MLQLKIAVIGAGPAGCMLARLLHLAGIPVTIFEAEQGLDFRSQGGSLDLHTDTGLKAMKQADLYSEFLKYARFDGEALTVADKHFVKYLKVGGTKDKSTTGRPEIDRPRLREILIKSVPAECIAWGKRVKSVGSNLTLNFEDGSERGFDLIVGADGAFSKVRPVLSSTSVMYSGIGGFQGSIEDAESRHPELDKLVNRGSLFCLSDHKFVGAQQMGDGSINASVWIVADERPTKKLDRKEAQALKKSIREDCRDWDPQLLEFISQSSDDKMIYRPLYMLPIGHSWEHKPGVTLIGDAAHLMTPFAGEGVNLALTDSMALAEAIIKTNETCKASLDDRNQVMNKEAILSQNIRAFEADMFQRATEVQQRTYDNMQIVFFQQGPPWVIIRTWLLRFLKKMTPGVLYPIVALLCYIYFYIRRLIC